MPGIHYNVATGTGQLATFPEALGGGIKCEWGSVVFKEKTSYDSHGCDERLN